MARISVLTAALAAAKRRHREVVGRQNEAVEIDLQILHRRIRQSDKLPATGEIYDRIDPAETCRGFVDKRRGACRIGQVGHRGRSALVTFDRVGSAFQRARNHDDSGTLFVKLPERCASDATRRAGEDDHIAVKKHWCTPPWFS
jgi:hypothetical protein